MKTPDQSNPSDPSETSNPSDQPAAFREWAKVELMGRQVVVGQVSETTLAGGAFLRVDVPSTNGQPAFTRFYRPEALYCLSPVTEEVARALLAYHRTEPVQRYELPKIAAKVSTYDCDQDNEDDEP